MNSNTTTVQLYTVAAFCHQQDGGNNAGIVIHTGNLTTKQKQYIATLANYSETVFITASSKADYRLEYFTPVEEVELCGHATIAAFTLLRQQGLKSGNYTIDTLAGILGITIDDGGTIWMQQCCPTFYETYHLNDFESIFPGLSVHTPLPIQAVSTGLKDILFPIDSPQQLDALQPDFEEMALFSKTHRVVGIHAFALTGHSTPIAICRNFAPLYGIDEESATGTSNCALACYLHRYHTAMPHYQFLQGITMRHTSAIKVHIESKHNQIERVMVGGEGKIIEERIITIPS